jgi:hypothetical protein
MMPDDFNSQSASADALSRVTDDSTEILAAGRWAEEELLAGRTPEAVVGQMTADGWDESSAEQIVENARKETRAERGVLTRDDVVRDLNVDYRRATGGLSVAFRSGLFGLYGFTTGFMAALRSLRKLKVRAPSKSGRSGRRLD